MGADDVTPILPGARTTRAPSSNGVPSEEIEGETTDQIIAANAAAGASEEQMTNLVDKAIESFIAKGGNGNGNDNGEKYVKEIKRHKWLATFLALLFGSGGMVGTFYALKAESAATAEKIQSAEPRIKKNTEAIRLIQVDVSDFKRTVGEMKTDQTAIVQGINDLKAERVKGIEDELEEAKREIRRRDRIIERNR